MESIGKVATALAQSPQQLTDILNASSVRLAETAKYTKLLLGCYRVGEANDPEVYTAAVIRVLSDYPIEVLSEVVDPRIGIPSKIKWLPMPPEIKEACEAVHGRILRRQEFDKRTEEQLTERERLARLPPAQQTYEEFKAEMAARGLPITRQDRGVESATKLKTKYGLTDAQWDAIPDLPPDHSDYWAGVRWQKT